MKVMGWPAFTNKAANPYTSLLYEALQRKGVEVVEFKGISSTAKPLDIVHVHWPDSALIYKPWGQSFVQCCRTLVILARAKWLGARVIWTAHNLQAHEKLHPFLEKIFGWLFLFEVDGVISLSKTAAKLVRQKRLGNRNIPVCCIAHGHYRDSYPNSVTREEARSRFGLASSTFVVGWIGQIRGYKGLEELVAAWPKMAATDRAVLIAGQSTDPALTKLLEESAKVDTSIHLQIGRVENDDLQYYFNAADVVIMPYRNILNSGSALLALSFNLPIALPRSEVMKELQDRVGAEWVHLYDGDFNEKTLQEILLWTQTTARAKVAPLSELGLDWDLLAGQTLNFYEQIIARKALPAISEGVAK